MTGKVFDLDAYLASRRKPEEFAHKPGWLARDLQKAAARMQPQSREEGRQAVIDTFIGMGLWTASSPEASADRFLSRLSALGFDVTRRGRK